MKSKFKFIKVFLLLAISLFSISCNRDNDPVVPENELDHKGHEEWDKVVVSVKMGQLNGTNFQGEDYRIDPDDQDGVYVLPREQRIIFERNEKGAVTTRREDLNVRQKGIDATGNPIYEEYYVARENNHPIEVVTSSELNAQGQLSGVRYSMEVVYYHGNERLNEHFVEPDQIDHHQHFFTANRYMNWLTNEVKTSTEKYFGDGLFKYIYRDTDPEDKMVANSANPNGAKLSNGNIGLKGYFYFAKNQVKFDMDMMLFHSQVSKYLNQGSIFPANNPSEVLLSKGEADLAQKISFVVVGDVLASDYKESLMKYYKIDAQTLEKYLSAPRKKSNFWL